MLERDFPEIVQREPELVAQHFARRAASTRRPCTTGDCRPPVAAAQRARRGRDAAQERAAARWPSCRTHAERALTELDLLLTLGPAQIAAKGYASSDVEATWTRAQTLCSTVGDVPQQFPALFGLWMFHCVRANHAARSPFHPRCFAARMRSRIEDLRLEAHLATGISQFFLADFAAAAAHFEACVAMYDRERHAAHRFQFGQDPAVVALNYRCWMHWIGGDDTTALATSARAVDLARSLDHPFTLSFALSYAAWLRLFLGNVDDARAIVRELLTVCTEHDIPVFLAWGRVLDALVRCEQWRARGGHACAPSRTRFLPRDRVALLPAVLGCAPRGTAGGARGLRHARPRSSTARSQA